jgi:hypothetical protein
LASAPGGARVLGHLSAHRPVFGTLLIAVCLIVSAIGLVIAVVELFQPS